MGKYLSIVALTMALVGGLSQASTLNAGDCCKPACECPPPPVSVSWCAEDPCNCCKYNVSACLPACCKDQVPCLAGWRHGIFGRKVLTYKFPCGECVEVVITIHGTAFTR